MTSVLSKLTPTTASVNRFAALMDDAKHPSPPGATTPTNVSFPKGVVTPPPTTKGVQEQDTNQEGPWLLAPTRKNASSRKKANTKQQPMPVCQVPKTLPKQVEEKALPDPNVIKKFAMDCRIKVQPHESVNPSKLVQAVLTIFQHTEPKTAVTTSMYNAPECPMIFDPLTTPTSKALLAPYISFWKKIREDLFLCRLHMVSESSFDTIKKDPQVLEYLKKELIIVERATLDSSDHVLVGFLVNVVPNQDTLSAQQYRFEKIMKNVPGFQLVTRKLLYKENSKLWTTVLKIRVDRADADELTLAFQAAALECKEFQYYAFDQYTSLHPDQKRYIIETQRNFLLQNRSVVVDWNINDVKNFVMWMTDDEYEEEVQDELNDVMFTDANITPKRCHTHTSRQQTTDSSIGTKRTLEDSAQTDQEINTPEKPKSTKMKPKPIKVFNNVDLTKVGIDEFLYSYSSGDGAPIIRYIYPEADGRREILVSRGKRAETNSFLKVMYRELARHMSAYSRVLAFNNPDEIHQEATLTSPWSPIGLHTMVPFSTTTSSDRSSTNHRNKRRSTGHPGSIVTSPTTTVAAPATVINTNSEVGTSSSLITDQSTASLATRSTVQGTTIISQQEELNSVKAQLSILQQQHTNLVQNVKQLSNQNTADKQELQKTIENTQNKIQSYVDQAMEQNVTQVTTSIGIQIRNEIQAVDLRHQTAQQQLRTEMSTEITSAITQLTSVVAKMELGQANFIQRFAMEKDNEQMVQQDQIALFLDNVKATGTPIAPNTNMEYMNQTSDSELPSATTCTNNTANNQSSIGSLPSTIGRVALTTLHGLNKRGGRGGGRDLRQQTLTQTTKIMNSGAFEASSSQTQNTPTSNKAFLSTQPPQQNKQTLQAGGLGNHHA